MKKKFGWISTILLIVGLVFCFVGCGDSKHESPSNNNAGDTTSLTLNFNGGKINDKTSIKFPINDIEDYVGYPIDQALSNLGFGIENLSRSGYEFVGWTLKKNGNNLVRYLPEYGVLYAKWDNGSGNSGLGGGDVVKPVTSPLSVTFDFNGGTMNGERSVTATYDDLKNYIGLDYTFVYTALGFQMPLKTDGSVYIGFSFEKNGQPLQLWAIPESGNYTLYAVWYKY